MADAPQLTSEQPQKEKEVVDLPDFLQAEEPQQKGAAIRLAQNQLSVLEQAMPPGMLDIPLFTNLFPTLNQMMGTMAESDQKLKDGEMTEEEVKAQAREGLNSLMGLLGPLMQAMPRPEEADNTTMSAEDMAIVANNQRLHQFAIGMLGSPEAATAVDLNADGSVSAPHMSGEDFLASFPEFGPVPPADQQQAAEEAAPVVATKQPSPEVD